MSEDFPWIQCFQAAMASGLAPEAIWHMTPSELALLLSAAPSHPKGLGRRELDALLAQFPDTQVTHDNVPLKRRQAHG